MKNSNQLSLFSPVVPGTTQVVPKVWPEPREQVVPGAALLKAADPGTTCEPARVSAQVVPDRSIAVREVCAVPVAVFRSLPARASLLCRSALEERPFIVTSSRAVGEACRAAKVPAFGVSELEHLAVGVVCGRYSPHDIVEWCANKRLVHHWRIQLDDVLGLRLTPPPWDAITIGDVVRAWWIDVLAVGVGDEVPR
jgi:hypothetical protein